MVWILWKITSRLTSRRSQPPLALSVPLTRFTSQVGGGSAFYVRHQHTSMTIKRNTEKAMLLAFACAAAYVGAYILFVMPLLGKEHLRFFQGLFLIVYFFGVIPCLFLFRPPGWVRATIAAVAFSTALILGWMTVRLFASLLEHPGSEIMIIVLGLRLSGWEFFGLVAVLALIVLGYIFGGLRILRIPP